MSVRVREIQSADWPDEGSLTLQRCDPKSPPRRQNEDTVGCPLHHLSSFSLCHLHSSPILMLKFIVPKLAGPRFHLLAVSTDALTPTYLINFDKLPISAAHVLPGPRQRETGLLGWWCYLREGSTSLSS